MKVLVVEDEPDILDNLVDTVLTYRRTASCKGCENPVTAMNLIQSERFDAVLLDIQLPSMNGFELGRQLRQKNPDLRIVITTAYNHYASEAFDLEVSDYLLKPVRQERLFKTLDKIVADLDERRQAMALADRSSRTYIQTFGRLAVYRGSTTLKWHRQKSAELFAYLLTHQGKPVGKYQLCEDIWPDADPDKAIVNLQTAISQLRKNLGDFRRDEIKIEYADNSYRLLIGDCIHDVQEFEKAAAKCMQASWPGSKKSNSDKDLLEAYGLYQGEYLGHESWLWALGRQQALEKKFIRIVIGLIDLAIRSDDKLMLETYLNRLADLLGEDSVDVAQYVKLRSMLI